MTSQSTLNFSKPMYSLSSRTKALYDLEAHYLRRFVIHLDNATVFSGYCFRISIHPRLTLFSLPQNAKELLPWTRVLSEKLTDPQLAKKFYGT